MKESGFKDELILEYSKVFDDQPKLETLLSGIGRSTLLKMSAFFLGFSNSNSEYSNPHTFVSMFFQTANHDLATYVHERIREHQEATGAKIIIPYTLTSLSLFEYAFQNMSEEETLNDAEIEVQVFKAYLFMNETLTNKANRAEETVKGVKVDNYLSEFMFTMTYADSDLINFDTGQVWSSQMVKSIMLFEMLERDNQYQPLLNAFLQYFECVDWKDYIKRLLPLVFACIQKREEAHIDIVLRKDNQQYTESLNFLKKLVITEDATLSEYDFSSVRANPIYQVDETTFRIVFPLFVLEMLHKGLYFKLSNINETLTKGKGKFPDFRGHYCDHFSENHLLYEVMNRMYGKRYKRFTGLEMKSAGLVAEPDYYIRNGTKVFLFESKDVLINAKVKGSFDFALLEAVLKSKFYFIDKGNSKIEKKAILQIINSVKNTLDKSLIVDSQYNEKSIIIYPILVTHHHQYEAAGLNNILKDWFNSELNVLADQGYKISNVRPLTVINIDDFILYQDLFLEKKILLEDLIEGYHKHTTFDTKKKYRSIEEAETQAKATLIPFSIYVTKYLKLKRLKAFPKILMEKGFVLFN